MKPDSDVTTFCFNPRQRILCLTCRSLLVFQDTLAVALRRRNRRKEPSFESCRHGHHAPQAQACTTLRFSCQIFLRTSRCHPRPFCGCFRNAAVLVNAYFPHRTFVVPSLCGRGSSWGQSFLTLAAGHDGSARRGGSSTSGRERAPFIGGGSRLPSSLRCRFRQGGRGKIRAHLGR